MTEQQQLQAGIDALQAQRATLGDAVVDVALAPLRARLAALQGDAGQQLRQASVLFADIVGSTALSQHLDAEDVHLLMDGALQRFTARVRAEGGRVMQYAGDSLLAVFGAGEAREDDAERAVRAGLGVLSEGRELRAEVLAQHAHDGFDVRVGIHTGAVLLGGGVDAENTVRGMAVNIAARMEQSAPAGALRISHDTWRHVRGVFDVEAQPPLQVKGSDEPLRTYLVQRAKPRAFRIASRGIDGVETPMVGRYAELAKLCAGFEAVLAERRLRAITIVGDAGLGKSRLLAEFQGALDVHPQSFWLLLGRAQPNGMAQAYGLLRDVFAWRFQIADSDPPEIARDKLVRGMQPLFADERPQAAQGRRPPRGVSQPGSGPSLTQEGDLPAHLIGQLIGLDFSASPLLEGLLGDARQLRDRAFGAATRLLERLAKADRAPLVMLLDDLHWADDGSLDFVRHLLVQERDLPLLLVMLARPALLERRPGWADDDPQHQRIAIAPLGPEDSDALTRVLLHRMPEVPAVLHALVTSGAEGNPFYMEELIKMLVDDGVITVDAGGWRASAERLRAAHVPTTLTGVLQARLDALAPTERSALQRAAIVGHVFWDAALDALEPGAAAALPALLRKELVAHRDGSAFSGAAEYVFQHHLLHQVTYDTVLKGPRRAGHARAAAWLAEHLGERADEYLGVAAEHYERAGDDAQALTYFERAAKEAFSRYATAVALAHTERALASPALTDLQRRARLLLHKIDAADRQGDRIKQRAALDERETLAETLGDEGLRADVKVDRALLADRQGDHPAAFAFATEALALGERAGNATAAATALGELAWVHCARGELDAARRAVERGLVWARQAARRNEVQLTIVAAEIWRATGDYAQAETCLRDARELARGDRDSRRLEASVLANSSELSIVLGDWPQAEAHSQATLDLAREIGIVQVQAAGLYYLASCRMAQGDGPGALRHVRAALEIHERAGDRRGLASDRLVEGQALRIAGEPAQALVVLEQALAAFRSLDDALNVRATLAAIAEVHREGGRAAPALACVEQILHGSPQGGGHAGELQVAWACCQVLFDAGDPRAGRVLDRAHAELQAMAGRVADPAARGRMLDNIAHHRRIVAAWRQLNATPPAQQPAP